LSKHKTQILLQSLLVTLSTTHQL